MRIGAPEQVAFFVENERRIELRGSSNDQLRSRPRRVRKQRTGADASERLPRTAVCAKYVVSGNTATAESTVDRLHLHRLAADGGSGHSITDPSRYQVLEVMRELVSQLARGSETIVRTVFDGAHQNVLHLSRD